MGAMGKKGEKGYEGCVGNYGDKGFRGNTGANGFAGTPGLPVSNTCCCQMEMKFQICLSGLIRTAWHTRNTWIGWLQRI